MLGNTKSNSEKSNSENNKYNKVNIVEIIYILKKRWKIFVTSIVTVVISATMLTLFFVEPQYETSTTVFVGKNVELSEGYNRSDIEMYQQLLKTYSEIIKTRDVIKSAIDSSGINKSLEDVSKDIDIITIEGTQVIEIRFRSESPEDSLNFINSLSGIFIEKAAGLIPNANLQVLDVGVLPHQPVVPNKKLTVVLGILLGIIMAIAVCYIMEIMNNTYKTRDQIEKECGIPVIGEIPKAKFSKEKANDNRENIKL